MGLFSLNPVTAKRWRRFRSFKRAWFSLCLLVALYGISLCSELICNSRPLLLWYQGRPYFPVFFHYSEHEFLGNGEALATDYRTLEANPAFQKAGGWMLWAPFRYGPNDQVSSQELLDYGRVNVHLAPVPKVGLVKIDGKSLIIKEFPGAESLLERPQNGQFSGHALSEFWKLPDDLTERLSKRGEGREDGAGEFSCSGKDGAPQVILRLLDTKTLPGDASGVWAKIVEDSGEKAFELAHLRFVRGESEPDLGDDIMAGMDKRSREQVLKAVKEAFGDSYATVDVTSGRTYGQASAEEDSQGETLMVNGRAHGMTCELERVAHPFRPVPEHWLGLDEAGRDVLARILYGLRTSLTFGLVLVVSSMLFGTMIGCLQGYLGGKVDMLGQRMIEIWSALPFLYIVILMGSLFGTGFWLLIVCYALFNWIGVSYYMRAEMLRLRKQPFVEAARCLGLPWWSVVWRHILPNALVPLVTFVPFSLVGAIGALAGLDYLGFGLPPPTPSLGQLLQQAQVQREAWWLILYPSVALFVVMLLCVFIGEGVREAFDPKRQSRIQ